MNSFLLRKGRVVLAICVVVVSIGSLAYAATTYTVAQKGKAFSRDSLEIQVGDTVRFPNQDPFYHNVYSLSPTKIFDLGSYGQGGSGAVTFDQPGEVEVRCAIHPEMRMKIIVK